MKTTVICLKNPTWQARKIASVRVIKLLVLAIILLAIYCAASVGVASADSKTKEEIEADLGDAVEEVISRINVDLLEKFISSLGADEQNFLSVNTVKDVIKELTSGSGNFFERLFSLLGIVFGRYFLGFLPSFITILAICILKNMLSGVTADFLDNSTTEVVHVVCYGAVITVLMSGIIVVLKTVVSTLSALSKFAEAVFPVLLTLISSAGGSASVSAYSPMLAVLSGGIISIIVKFVVPAFIATIVFSVVGNLSKTVKLESSRALSRLHRRGLSEWCSGCSPPS